VKRLSFAEQARRDLRDIESYWKERADLVEAFYAAVRDATHFLMETPAAGAPVDPTGLRKWRVGRTPFLLLYRATQSELRIFRVVHRSQNWRRML
jgi:toxin ParE1/3/4